MIIINSFPVVIERFPDGTPHLNVSVDSDAVKIEWFYEKDEEMILFYIARHLREQYAVSDMTLYMPYIPNARMDRVKEKQNVFTLKYFCEFINSMCFDKVIVRDAHSFVSLALINNVVSEPVDENIMYLIKNLLDADRDIVFYPDEGSFKRYSDVICFPSAFGIKKRDWNTGKILGLDVHGDLPTQPFDALIVDDISSYGGTFLHSAGKLKEYGADRIYMYVTHCENSVLSGELINSGLFEKIYTTKSIFTGNHPLIEIIGQ